MSEYKRHKKRNSVINDSQIGLCFVGIGIFLIIGVKQAPFYFISLIYGYFLAIRGYANIRKEMQGIKLDKPCDSCFEKTVTKCLIRNMSFNEISCKKCGSIAFEKASPSLEQKSFFLWGMLLMIGMCISPAFLLALSVIHGIGEIAYKNKSKLIKAINYRK